MPNYKKISNPEGTTSLLALSTPPTNIEYAGLTRFEIPFETEEATTADVQESTTSPAKKPKLDDLADNQHQADSNTSEHISIENIHKSIMDFTEANEVVEKASDAQKEILDNLYETTAAVAASLNAESSYIDAPESAVVDWSNKASEHDQEDSNEKKETVGKKSHFSLGDLENDPIVNKDLQQLHKDTCTSHYITNITNNNNNNQSSNLITPPATVCSSVASNASYSGHQQASTHVPVNTNLSINPSSTSSTSSTQMISPVGSTSDNMRSASVDHHQQQQQQQQQKSSHQYNL